MKSLRCVLFLFLVVLSRAHDAGISIVEIKLRPGGFTVTTGYAPLDAEGLVLRPDEPSEAWSVAQLEQARPRFLALATQVWEAKAGGVVLPPQNPRVESIDADNVTLAVDYAVPSSSDGRVELRTLRLGQLLPGHRQYATVLDAKGAAVMRKLIDAVDPVFAFPVAPVAAADAPTFWGFLKLGVEHIWTGYDHLLFLFGLLLVCRSFRSVVIVITCFTLAHSFTLALATLDLVNLPSRLVESIIAASIVFVGVENLWRRGEEPKGRWVLTFVFGLIHGFGFATVLRELGAGAEGGGGLLMPLFTFNLGVELGQVAVAAVVLPVFWQLRKNEKFARVAPPVLSALIALAGLYWLAERLFEL